MALAEVALTTPEDRIRSAIKVALAHYGWTQKTFAGRLGMSAQTLSERLAGPSHGGSKWNLYELELVAEALAVEIGDLFGGGQEVMRRLSRNGHYLSAVPTPDEVQLSLPLGKPGLALV